MKTDPKPFSSARIARGLLLFLSHGSHFLKYLLCLLIDWGLFFWTLLCFPMIGLCVPTYLHVICLHKLREESASWPHWLWAWPCDLLWPMGDQEYVTLVKSNQELKMCLQGLAWSLSFPPPLRKEHSQLTAILWFRLQYKKTHKLSWTQLIHSFHIMQIRNKYMLSWASETEVVYYCCKTWLIYYLNKLYILS